MSFSSVAANYKQPKIENYQFATDPFSSAFIPVSPNKGAKEHDLKKVKESEVFKNGYSTIWKEVALNTNPVFHTLAIYPFKNSNIVVDYSLQLDKCVEGEIVKLGCDRFFKLDLSKDGDLSKKFNNKNVYLISNGSKIWLPGSHAKAGINFRTPAKFDCDAQHYFKIVGDNSDLYSVNIEIANLKV